MAMKESMDLEELCQGLPEEFKIFLEYSKSLEFEEKPEYLKVRRMFKELFFRCGFEFDHIYDWLLIPMVAFSLLILKSQPTKKRRMT